MTTIAETSDLSAIDREVDKIVGSGDGKTLDELETMRQNYLFWFYIGLIAIVTATVIGFYAENWYRQTHGPDKGFGNVLILGWGAIILIALSPIHIYKNNARQILMPDLVQLFGDLKWAPAAAPNDSGFWQDLRMSQLIGYYDDASVHDFITGAMKQTPVVMTEMVLSRGSGKHREIIFKGAAASIHLNKSAPLWLALKPHQIELNLFPNPTGGDEVKIPSPDFTRNFSAYSNDQVLARTLLTPDVVEQITNLALSFGKRSLGISLRGDCLFLMAHGDGELAPESLFTSVYKLDRVHWLGRQLYMLSTLIDTIMKDWRLDSATPYQPQQAS